jgi:putative chitinase
MDDLALAAALAALCPRLPAPQLHEYLPHLSAALEEFHITTPGRVAAFLAQVCHESDGLRHWEENLNYSAEALLKTWPKRFTPAGALGYARKPEKIANCAYANRMGNGLEESGDGWRYRGRGPIQLTGRDNYRAYGKRLGLPLEAEPEQVATPAAGFRVAGAFWAGSGLNELADSGKFQAITLKVNGGTTGQAQRLALYQQAQDLLA